MVKLTERHSYQNVEDYFDEVKKYLIKCPCCGTILFFNKEDVYKDEDDCMIHHEYIDCPECNEQIQLSDDEYYGY